MAKILLIDDDPLVLDSVRLVLESAGHQVVSVSDGGDALNHIPNQGVELVITDIIMPGHEGLETILNLRRLAPELAVIAISGGARVGTSELLPMAAKLGASATLRKPFPPGDLLGAVDRLLARQRPAGGRGPARDPDAVA